MVAVREENSIYKVEFLSLVSFKTKVDMANLKNSNDDDKQDAVQERTRVLIQFYQLCVEIRSLITKIHVWEIVKNQTNKNIWFYSTEISFNFKIFAEKKVKETFSHKKKYMDVSKRKGKRLNVQLRYLSSCLLIFPFSAQNLRSCPFTVHKWNLKAFYQQQQQPLANILWIHTQYKKYFCRI